jgi:hypothetical protein
MVFNKKGYIEFCLTNCPNLKQLDLKKVSPEMREQSGIFSTGDDKKAVESASRSDSTAIDTDNYLGKIGSGV